MAMTASTAAAARVSRSRRRANPPHACNAASMEANGCRGATPEASRYAYEWSRGQTRDGALKRFRVTRQWVGLGRDRTGGVMAGAHPVPSPHALPRQVLCPKTFERVASETGPETLPVTDGGIAESSVTGSPEATALCRRKRPHSPQPVEAVVGRRSQAPTSLAPKGIPSGKATGPPPASSIMSQAR
jgi:hypothetical protein